MMVAWWHEFIQTISSGSWAATLLQGVITGAAAIGVAFWILRSQLAADRKLAEDERTELQRIAQQDKAAGSAADVGRILVQIALSTRDLSNRDLGALLRTTSKPLDIDLANKVRVDAAIYFPSFKQHLAVARLKERDALWAVGRSVISANPSFPDEAIGSAMRKALGPADVDLHAIGKELIRWSGEGVLPDCLGVVKSVHPYPTASEAKPLVRNEWKRRAELAMEATAKAKIPRAVRTSPA